MALSVETIKILNDLQDDINQLLSKESNIEVIWGLEKLHNENVLLSSSEYIRKVLNKTKQN